MCVCRRCAEAQSGARADGGCELWRVESGCAEVLNAGCSEEWSRVDADLPTKCQEKSLGSDEEGFMSGGA